MRAAHLATLLAAHPPGDPRETRHLAQMRAHLAAGEQAFSRAAFSPGHFTASAFVVSADRSALLLIFHEKLRRWLQPGGHVDPGDADILAAARREVREEVGLSELPLISDGVFDVDIHEIPARPARNEPAHLHLDVRFLFESTGAEARAASDALACRWVPLDEVSALESDASVARAVTKLQRQALAT